MPNADGNLGGKVATNQQRREAAKRKLDRQIARRAERARRRKIVGTGVTVGAVIMVAGVVVFMVTRGDTPESEASGGNEPTESNSQTQATSGPCEYKPASGNSAAKDVSLPPDPEQTPSEGTVRVSLETNQGSIGLTLDRGKAPCTVQSIEHLVSADFYDETPCHRMVAAETLHVLQCGDPTGKGTGGPGYTIPDEPPSDLKPAGEGQAVIYPRGTLAMAKSRQPDSGGSQFFMVHEDSELPPQYTVFGTVSDKGLQVVDKIAEAGIEGDKKSGPPANEVTISDAEVVNRS